MTVKCEVCDSEKIIPDVRVVDQGEYSDGNLNVIVMGDPEAMIFKDRLYGKKPSPTCAEIAAISNCA